MRTCILCLALLPVACTSKEQPAVHDSSVFTPTSGPTTSHTTPETSNNTPPTNTPPPSTGEPTPTTTSSETTTNTTAVPGVELISDRHFSLGFSTIGPISGLTTGDLSPGFSTGAPVWTLGQWGSDSDLINTALTSLSSGAVSWDDPLKSVTVGPNSTPEADLTLLINAYDEYQGVYRSPTDANTWPHLLAEQRLSPPGNAGPGCPSLSTLDSLVFSADAKLLFDNRNLGPGHDPSTHAAAYLIYFTVQNLNYASTGYGDYLWFGLTLYDDREPMPDLAVAGDDATGKLIYNIGLSPLTASSLNDNSWHPLEADLLPHILLALDEAWARGYLPDSTNLADYKVGGMNLGWEVPGLNEASLQLKDLSLAYTTPLAQGGAISYLFDVDGDRQGWSAANLVDVNSGPLNGVWTLLADQADPALTSPPINADSATLSTLKITLANYNIPPTTPRMQVFWSISTAPGFSEAQSAWIDIHSDGLFHTYEVDLAASPSWSGTIDSLRVDPIEAGEGQQIQVQSIELVP